MRPPHAENPFNEIPTIVLVLVAAIGGIEIVFQLAGRGLLGGASGVGWRIEALNAFAFSPPILERMWETNTWPLQELLRFVSYAFVHYNFTHVLFVLVFLLALGKMVAEIFSSWAVVAVLAASAIGGAVAHTIVLSSPAALVGGYPAVYGLIGAYTFILWVGLGAAGQNQSRAFTLIAFLLGIQLIFGLVFGGSNEWVADIAGFAAGFALSFVVSPGGWRRVMVRLRQR